MWKQLRKNKPMKTHSDPVNMFEGFADRYLADDIHYNTEGAGFIAQRYYEVLENVLE